MLLRIDGTKLGSRISSLFIDENINRSKKIKGHYTYCTDIKEKKRENQLQAR